MKVQGIMTNPNVITVEPLAGQWIVYGQGYYSIHAWRSLAILTAEQIAARDGAHVIVHEDSMLECA